MPFANRVTFIVGSTIDEPGDPNEVTACMGVEPSNVTWSDLQSLNPASDQFETHRAWSWVIHSPLGDEVSASQRVSALVESLLPLRDRIRAIPNRYWRFIQCLYDSTPNDFLMLSDAGIILSVKCMRDLVDLDLELAFCSRVWTPDAYRVNIETKLAEQVVSPNRSATPSLNSKSSARGSED